MAATQPAAPPPAPETKPERIFPEEPGPEHDRAVAEVRPMADLLLGFADVAAERLPPRLALTDKERETLRAPLERVIFKYGGSASPEYMLAAAVAMIALPRYLLVKQGIRTPAQLAALMAGANAPAAATTVEVTP